METEKILLRPWLDSDAETLFKYASDPDVVPRAGWPPHQSVEESLEVIRNVFNKLLAIGWQSPIGTTQYMGEGRPIRVLRLELK